jgi:hypothetical protein
MKITDLTHVKDLATIKLMPLNAAEYFQGYISLFKATNAKRKPRTYSQHHPSKSWYWLLEDVSNSNPPGSWDVWACQTKTQALVFRQYNNNQSKNATLAYPVKFYYNGAE